MDELIANIQHILSTNFQLKMYYLTKTKRRNTPIEYLSFGVPIASSIRREIGELVLSESITRLTDCELVPFDTTNTEAGTIEHLLSSDVNNLDAMLESISTLTTENLSELNFNEIWGYIIRITSPHPDNKSITLFKKFAYPKVMKKGLVLSLFNGSYNKLDESPVTITNDTDSLLFDDYMYIFNKRGFEGLFNFSSAYQQQISASISSLQTLDIVDNLDGFIDYCLSSDTLTRRFVKILHENRFETVSTYSSRIPQIISDFQLNVNFDSSTDKIIYDSSSSVSDILTLIRGACVVGALDGQNYLASSTRILPA